MSCSPSGTGSRPARTILFVGQNLARASRSRVPFEGTKTGQLLSQWIREAGLRESCAIRIRFVNVSSRKTPGNRPLKVSEIRAGIRRREFVREVVAADMYVAVGRQAVKALQMVAHKVAKRRGSVPCMVQLEHPSGRNRNLNDPKVRADQPERLRRALSL